MESAFAGDKLSLLIAQCQRAALLMQIFPAAATLGCRILVDKIFFTWAALCEEHITLIINSTAGTRSVSAFVSALCILLVFFFVVSALILHRAVLTLITACVVWFIKIDHTWVFRLPASTWESRRLSVVLHAFRHRERKGGQGTNSVSKAQKGAKYS